MATFPTINLADFAAGQEWTADEAQTVLASGLKFAERACLKACLSGISVTHQQVLDRQASWRLFFPVDCRIKEIVLQTWWNGYGVDTNVKFGVYDESSGAPNNLLASGGPTLLTNTYQQVGLSLSDYLDITGGNHYWLSILTDATIYFTTFHGTDNSGMAVWKTVTNQYSLGLPNPHPTTGLNATKQLSCWVY